MSADTEAFPVVTVRANRPTRRPSALVCISDTAFVQNAAAVPGWVSWTVSSNSFYSADTFEVVFACSRLPAAQNANWFSEQRELYVEILAGYPTDPAAPQASELQSLIYGRVDTLEFDPVQKLLTLKGRDLTAVFIDNRVPGQFLQDGQFYNQTSSNIVQTIVAPHQLDSVISPTSTQVGSFYGHDQVLLSADTSEWDLLAYLARQEGFICFVAGGTLHFQPDPTDTSNPYEITWQEPTTQSGSPVANVVELEFSRTLTVSKGITVTVRSPNLLTKKPVVESYPRAAKTITPGKASPFGASQPYYYNLASNLTHVKAQAIAQQKYREIISHEMKLRATLPGDNILNILMPIRVSGTDTQFDQTYFPREITRSMSIEEGYSMRVAAQNINASTAPAS